MATSARNRAPVTICEPGYFTGRAAMTPWSLPKATIEPVRLTEPMIAPSSVAITKASGQQLAAGLSAGVAQELDDRHERRGAAAGAVEDRDHLRHRGHRDAPRTEHARDRADEPRRRPRSTSSRASPRW